MAGADGTPLMTFSSSDEAKDFPGEEPREEPELHNQVARAIALEVPITHTYRARLASLRAGHQSVASDQKIDRIGSEYRANQDTITPAQEESQDWHESLYRLNCQYDPKEEMYFAISTRLPRRVMTSINLKRVGDIDLRKESFRALFHLYLNWLPTKEEYREMQLFYFQVWSARRIAKWLLELNEKEKANPLSEYNDCLKYPEAFIEAMIDAHVDGFLLDAVLPGWEKIDDMLAAFCGGDTEVLFPPQHPHYQNGDGFWNELMEDIVHEEHKFEEFRLRSGAWKPEFVPRIEPRNTVNIHSMSKEEYPVFDAFKITKFKKYSDGLQERNILDVNALERSYWIRQRINLDVTFSEELELDSFPFDYQDLTIPLRENSNSSKCVLTPELRDGRFFACDPTGFALQEYRLVAVHCEVMKMPATRGNVGYSAIILRVKMRRNWRYYVWRVVGQMMMITGLSLCAFSMDGSNQPERLAYLVTLLLTAVAFQTVIQNELPNTPYMTRMDEYILICFLFMTALTVETGAMLLFSPELDRLFAFLFCGGFVLYHLLYIFMIGCLDRMSELEKIDRNPLLEQMEKEVYFKRKPVKFRVQDRIERLSTDPKKEWFRFSGKFYTEEVGLTFCQQIQQWVTTCRTWIVDESTIEDLPPERDFCQCNSCLQREKKDL